MNLPVYASSKKQIRNQFIGPNHNDDFSLDKAMKKGYNNIIISFQEKVWFRPWLFQGFFYSILDDPAVTHLVKIAAISQ